MANNRMFLVCRGCGKGFLLAKAFHDKSMAYYPRHNNNDLMFGFFEEHSLCDEDDTCNAIDAENQFKLSYENAIDQGVDQYNGRG